LLKDILRGKISYKVGETYIYMFSLIFIIYIFNRDKSRRDLFEERKETSGGQRKKIMRKEYD
jgi:hypothetical protein